MLGTRNFGKTSIRHLRLKAQVRGCFFRREKLCGTMDFRTTTDNCNRGNEMSVTGDSKDPIPHGLKGYRTPWNCRCDVCKAANTEYNRGRRKARQQAKDELAEKREQRKQTLTRNRNSGKATESGDSDPTGMGRMERAVVKECAELEKAGKRPTLVEAARNLAKIVDNPKLSSIHTSTTKQLMAILSDLHGDTEAKKATGKRKSGGRLATVGNLTKVKRAQ
jgi:hypothetical protein